MINKDQYEKIAECIRSEQMSAPEVAELFEDGKFYKWYKKEYNLSSDREDISQKEREEIEDSIKNKKMVLITRKEFR